MWDKSNHRTDASDTNSLTTNRRSFMGGIGATAGFGSLFGPNSDLGGSGNVPGGSDATFYVFRDTNRYRVASSTTGGTDFTIRADRNAEEAFQYAFDNLPDRGGTVVASTDEFRFGGPATMSDGTWLTGGVGTRFSTYVEGQTDGFLGPDRQFGPDIIRLRGDGVAVTNIEFDGAGTQVNSHAVQADECTGVLMANNRTVNGFQMALSFTGCENVVVRGNEVTGPAWYGITSRGTRDDIDLKQSSDVLIAGNRVSDLSFNNIAPYNVSNFSVVGNLCYRGGHSLIACSPAQQGTIIGNICRDLELESIAADPGGEAGLEIEYKETHLRDDVKGTPEETSFDITVANNHVENCGVGFICRTVPSDSADEDEFRQTKRPYSFSVTGNAINSCDTGILVRSGANGVVATNTLRDNDTQVDIRDSSYTAEIQTGLNATR